MLAIGGWIFWTFIISIFVAIIYTVETEGKAEVWWPLTWLVIGSVTFIYFFKRAEFWPWLQSVDWYKALMYLGGYLLIGVFWLFFKWRQLSRRRKKKYLDTFAIWKTYKGTPKPGEEEKFELEEIGKKQELKDSYMPVVSEEAQQINSWIIFFPFSMLRYIFNNLLSDFFSELRKRLTGTLNNIAKSQFEKE